MRMEAGRDILVNVERGVDDGSTTSAATRNDAGEEE